MDRFDEKGKLIIPENHPAAGELEKCGVSSTGGSHVHHAYCPNGHELITEDNPVFSTNHGIKLAVKGVHGEDVVYLSPYLVAREKIGGARFQAGDKLDVCCPVCGVRLPIYAPCDCQWNGEYVFLALEKKQGTRTGVCFCNVWGCPKGNIRLADDVVAEFGSTYTL